MGELAQTRRNAAYLPDLALPAEVSVSADLGTLKPADLLLYAAPSGHIQSILHRLATTGLAKRARVAVSCAKGIELHSGKRMSELMGDALPDLTCAVLTGPNHAEEVSRRLATAAVVACSDEETALLLQNTFTLPWFRCYTTPDLIGAEWGGALKNPYAIAAGIAKGLDLGDNAIAALVTRALAEMVRLGSAAGGQVETFYGLSGVGDLVATCYSTHSRNHRVGLALGRGSDLQSILATSTMIAEGVPNTASLFEASRHLRVRTPLLDEIHAILYQGKSPAQAMRDLLSRDPRREVD